jgi:peptide/nickel transport system substrate-binding protein
MKRLIVALVAITVAVSLIAAGCGTSSPSTTSDSIQGGGASSSTTGETTSQDTSTSIATTSAKYGGTLRIMAGLAPGTAGGWPSDFASMSDDAKPALETLVRIDKDGNVIPWLAESYTVADDSKSITLKLRQGVTFHDGSVFNAEVAKWNLDNYIAANSAPPAGAPASGGAPPAGAPASGGAPPAGAPASGGAPPAGQTLPPAAAPAAGTITSVDILDDYTIRVNLNAWSNLIWSTLYESGTTMMVSKAAFEKNGKEWMMNNPVGTGPFMFQSFQPSVSIKFVRNPSYWKKDDNGKQLPYLDGVDITYIADPITQKSVMQAGEGDMTDISIVVGKSAADYKDLGLEVNPIIGASLCLIPDTANADSPYAKQEVREALEYAIDREAIAKAFAYGMWTAQYQVPGPACNAYSSDFANTRKYDPAKAKQLLTQAGYPNGFSTTIVVMPITSTGQDIYLALQASLAAVGIKAELDFTQDFPAYMDAVNSKHSMLNAMQLTDNNANYSSSLNLVLGQTAMFNKNWQRTPEFEALFNASLTSKTAETKSIRAVTDYLSQQSLLIPVAGSGRAWAKQPYVMNLGAGQLSMPAFWMPEQTWLDK